MSRAIGRPHFIDVHQNTMEPERLAEAQKEIRTLFDNQPFAVLATQGDGITDASLVTIAVSEDLRNIVFATPIRTGKYDFIAANENVSILADDRTLHQNDINQISALTVFGKAKILSSDEETKRWGKLLIDQHPELAEFVQAPTSAVILVKVTRYLYVKHFQNLMEWNPDD